MVDKSRRIAKKLAAKLQSKSKEQPSSRIFSLRRIASDIKKNWVEIGSVTKGISGIEPKSLGLSR